MLPAGQPTLRVLHLSDLHLTPRTPRPDGVGALARRARPRPRRRHRRLPRAPGGRAVAARRRSSRCSSGRACSCSGRNDYFAPAPVKPWRYLTAPSELDERRAPLPWGDLVKGAERGRLARPVQRARLGSPSTAARSTSAASTTRTSCATATTRSPARSPPTPTSRSASRTRPTCACSTRWPPTAPASCSPATPTAASSCIPGYGALVTNCDLRARRRPRASPGTRGRGTAPATPGSAARRARRVAARLGRARHLAVRPGAVRLPARGDPAHPHARTPDPETWTQRRARPPASTHLGFWTAAGTRFGRGRRRTVDSPSLHRGVAQLGSALRSGRRGRRFKSCHPDFMTRAALPYGRAALS